MAIRAPIEKRTKGNCSITSTELTNVLLGDVVQRSIIVSYKEDVDQLYQELVSSGLKPQIYRATYTTEELRYSAMTRCLISHHAAWQAAAQSPGYTLICEADFVPCTNLGSLPVFWPLKNSLAWAYLYQGSPRIMAIVGREGFIRGHCAPLVAYVINNQVGQIFLRYFEHQMHRFDPMTYFTFDAHLQWWTMGQGAEAYIPLKHYGEHGGSPNPEHARLGALSREGSHRADNLAAPLAFLPGYSNDSRLHFLVARAEARALGWARLLAGRWIIDTNVYRRTWLDTVRMQLLGVRRLLP